MITPIRKAVIPAAGFGTRLLPVSKVVPKELLPLVDKPVLHYIVEEAIASGISEIQIVISQSKESIRGYFTDTKSLDGLLKDRPEYKWIEGIRMLNTRADISFTFQVEQKGLANAVLQSETFVDDQPFAVLLGDAVTIAQIPVLAQLISVYEQYGAMVIGTEQVPADRVQRYGVIDGIPVSDHTCRIRQAIEKPKPGTIASTQVIAGRYLFTADVFTILKQLPLGHAGEIQLTDAIDFYCENF